MPAPMACAVRLLAVWVAPEPAAPELIPAGEQLAQPERPPEDPRPGPQPPRIQLPPLEPGRQRPNVKRENVRSTSPRCRESPARNAGRVAGPSCSSVQRVTASKDELALLPGTSRLAICFRPSSDMAHERLSMDLVSSRIEIPFSVPAGRYAGQPEHGPQQHQQRAQEKEHLRGEEVDAQPGTAVGQGDGERQREEDDREPYRRPPERFPARVPPPAGDDPGFDRQVVLGP